MKLSPDDPRITAYALEELSAEERAEIRAALPESPECQRELAAIRESANMLQAALEQEAAVQLTPAQERAIQNYQLHQQTAAPWYLIHWRQLLAWAGAAALVGGAAVWLTMTPRGQHQQVATSPDVSDEMPTVENASTESEPNAPITPTAPPTPPLPNKVNSTQVLEMAALPIAFPEPAVIGETQTEAVVAHPVPSPPEPAPVAPVRARSMKLAALPIHLPAPTLKGTPEDLPSGPNIEPGSDKPRPLFLAPEGVVNLALSKKVVGSDARPFTGTYDQVSDGEKEAFDDQVVEMRRGIQWVMVDLGAPCTIYAVALWHDHRWLQVYKNVIVQVADDADFTQNVRTIFNNDMDNSSGRGIGTDKQYFETAEGKLIDAKGVKARYVRCYSKGSNLSAINCIQEVEVYGFVE